RSVYDGQEHGEAGGRIRNHNHEIEMCNFHFHFVDSITELLSVRMHCEWLFCFFLFRSQVTETNSKLQDAGKELLNTMEELKQCREQQRNSAATVNKLSLPVLEVYNKLQEQMKAKNRMIEDACSQSLSCLAEGKMFLKVEPWSTSGIMLSCLWKQKNIQLARGLKTKQHGVGGRGYQG
ncbi:EXC6B protein, partial [Polyodon spathula]|nr:EXC6B protein [Polyodon spathula]